MVNQETLLLNAKLLPFLLVGMLVGDRLANRIEERVFRRILLLSLLVIGLNFLRVSLAAASG